MLQTRRTMILIFTSVMLMVFCADTVAQMPPDYIAAADAICVPLYSDSESCTTTTLENAIARDGATFGSLVTFRSSDRALFETVSQINTQLLSGAVHLVALAGIDEVQPIGIDVLRNGVKALIGDDAAKEKFENSIGGVILAEVAKYGFRSAYRKTLASRRRFALDLWKVADKHSGPTLTLDQYGIGVVVGVTDGKVTIQQVLKEGSAQSAGIEVGEKIIAIDGFRIPRDGMQEVTTRILGRLGSSVEIKLESQTGVMRTLDVKRESSIPLDVLDLDLNSSWGGAFHRDALWMTNISGKTLNNCTLVVRLENGDASQSHIHFVRRWAAGQQLLGVYAHQSDYTPQETLQHIERVRVWLFSDEASFQETYVYSGSEFEDDFDRYWAMLKFRGRLQPRSDGFFGTTHGGVDVSFTGIRRIYPESVTVILSDGSVSRSVTWKFAKPWVAGGWPNEELFRHSEFDYLSANQFVLRFKFPGLESQPELSWGAGTPDVRVEGVRKEVELDPSRRKELEQEKQTVQEDLAKARLDHATAKQEDAKAEISALTESKASNGRPTVRRRGRVRSRPSASVASFRKSAYWNNDAYETSIKGATGALAAADIRELKNGVAEIRVEVQAESSAFKFYSSPLVSLVIADDTGAIIETVDVSVGAMSFGGEVRKKVRRARKKMEANDFANAAYVFFRLQFCTWRQGFDRRTKESKGCTPIVGGPFVGTMEPKLENETEELAKQLPKQIDTLDVAIGQKFEFLGWQAIRLK